MLRITPSANAQAAKQYYTQGLTRSDYYIAGQELPGVWGGKAAERLGLSGEVDQKAYFALCDNRNPNDGSKLTPRDKDNRRVGYDFTFSMPKSASVLYELSGDERILDAFRGAVLEQMDHIETEMKTRDRKGGADADRVTGNMVYSTFVHFTSRPVDGKPDPHTHAHVFVFNTTWDEREKRWKAGQFGDLKRDAPYWEAAFDARLSAKLNALSYATEKDPKYSFEVAGVPESLIDKFSGRRNQIEKAAAEKGIVDAKGKHKIGYYGREGKALEMAKADLRGEWDSRLSPDERKALADVMQGKGRSSRSITADQAMQYAIDHSFERESVVSEKRLKAEALRHGVGSVLPHEIDKAAMRPDIIRVVKDGEMMVTTQAVLNDERRMLAAVRNGQGRYAPLGENASWFLPEHLTAEQGAASAYMLNNRDFVSGLRAPAGAGKTTVLKGVVGAMEKNGQRINVYAPSANASRGTLRSEGIANANTLESLFKNEREQERVRGSVLLVDEAGMVSTRDMNRLIDVAQKQQCRVLLVGDYRQNPSVRAGDSMRLLESEAGARYAKLTTIRRQKEVGYRKVVEEISKGTAASAKKGFEALDRMGCIVEAGPERHGMLVNDYLESVKDGKSALIVCPTHYEGERLTQELREKLKERGALGNERTFITRRATQWTDAQKGDARNYQKGMVIETYQNCKQGWKRGECGVVVGTEGGVSVLATNGTVKPLPAETDRFQVFVTKPLAVAKGERIRITQNGNALTKGGRKKRLNNGDILTVEGFDRHNGDIKLSDDSTLPKTYGHFNMGYVDTSHASQSKTVDRVFVSLGSESRGAMNQREWYVDVSRGREAAKVYVDDKADVKRAIARSGERLSAVELVNHRNRQVEQRLERNRLNRYYERTQAPQREVRRHG